MIDCRCVRCGHLKSLDFKGTCLAILRPIRWTEEDISNPVECGCLCVEWKNDIHPAERAALRIRQISKPSHADYKRIIDEEYSNGNTRQPCGEDVA